MEIHNCNSIPEMAIQKNINGHIPCQHMLACAIIITGWLILYYLKPSHTTKSKLMICQQLSQTYSTPDECSSKGGPPFTSCILQEFLQTWCVKHRLPSVTYPQSNGWAEFTVKTTRRILNGNSGIQGSLDNDSVTRTSCSTQKSQSKKLGYYQHNSYAIANSVVPLLHN